VISIEAKNEQQIKNAIKDLKKESFKNIRNFMKASVVVGAGVASKNAPVGTPESTGVKGYVGGTLRQSIDSRVKDGGFQGEIFSGVKYAQYQNNGTSRIRGKRFMEKGVTAALNTLTKLLKK
jgi:HK97 gp10 family phage protein